MKESFDTVALQEIGDSRLFDIHAFIHKVKIEESLLESFKLSGILSPPVLMECASGGYDIVCGRKRLHFANIAGYKTLLCRILPSNTPIDKILGIVLEDQYHHGPLSLIEQARFLNLCQQLIGDEDQRKKFLQSLPKNRIAKGTHFLLPLSSLEPPMQEKIHREIIPEKVVVEFLRLSREDQIVYSDLAQALQISGNNQKKLISQLADLVKREGVTLERLLKRKEIQEILKNENVDKRHQQILLLEVITHLHRPRLKSASKAFEKKVAALNLPDNCSLTPASSFERDELTLGIRFTSLAEFNEAWPAIKEVVQMNSTQKKKCS